MTDDGDVAHPRGNPDETAPSTDPLGELAEVDRRKPNIARMYDYLLGGTANFAVDREMAEEGLRLVPTERDYCRHNRAFLGRAVRHLVTEAGIDQFLDLGSGVPTVGNVHDIAQQRDPNSRVAYVDWELVACHHARQLTASNPQVTVTEADVSFVQQSFSRCSVVPCAPAGAATVRCWCNHDRCATCAQQCSG